MVREKEPREIGEQIVLQEPILTFQVGDREISVPREKWYTKQHIATATGATNLEGVMYRFLKARKEDPSIQVQRLASGKANRTLVFDEENFKRAVTAILLRMTPSLNKDLPQPKEYTTPDGRTIILTHPHKIRIIDSLTATGDKGSYAKDLARTITNSQNPTPKEIRNVSSQICFLRQDGFPIENITPTSDRREGGRSHYVLSGIKDHQTRMEDALKREGQDSTSDNQDGVPNNKDNDPFSDEHDRRAMLGKTKEGIRKELGNDLTTIFLSHLATGNMEQLTKDPKEFLKNLLPRLNKITKIRLSLVIDEPEEQFLFNEFAERVKLLWRIEEFRSTDSVLQKRVIQHCLDLKEKGYTLKSTIDTFCAHFSLPIPTSSPGLGFPKDISHF